MRKVLLKFLNERSDADHGDRRLSEQVIERPDFHGGGDGGIGENDIDLIIRSAASRNPRLSSRQTSRKGSGSFRAGSSRR